MTPDRQAKLLQLWRQDLAFMHHPGWLSPVEVRAMFLAQSDNLRRRIMYRLRERGWLLKQIGWIFSMDIKAVSEALQREDRRRAVGAGRNHDAY